VRGRDLEMEETRGSRESARKIFKMGARSGQKREECKRNRVKVKSGKRAAKFGDITERGEEGERNTSRGTGVPVKKGKVVEQKEDG
jgi:hypothetical protein